MFQVEKKKKKDPSILGKFLLKIEKTVKAINYFFRFSILGHTCKTQKKKKKKLFLTTFSS